MFPESIAGRVSHCSLLKSTYNGAQVTRAQMRGGGPMIRVLRPRKTWLFPRRIVSDDPGRSDGI